MTPPDLLACRDAFRRLDDYLDRALDPEDMLRVERHLDVCVVCAREFRFEASLLTEIRGKLQRIAVPPDLHARVWDRARRAHAPDAAGGTEHG